MYKEKESEIQKSILEFLQYIPNIYFFRAGAGAVKLQNGGFFKSGKPGVPDIILLKKGKFIGLEVKTKTGKQSVMQKNAEKEIKDSGGRYFIVRSIDDVERILKSC